MRSRRDTVHKESNRAPTGPPAAPLQDTGDSRLRDDGFLEANGSHAASHISEMSTRAQSRATTRQLSGPRRYLSGLPHSDAPDPAPSPSRPCPGQYVTSGARARPRRKTRAWEGGRVRGAGRGKGECLPAAAATTAAAATAAASRAEELAEPLPSEPARSSRPDSGCQRREHSPL